MWRTRNAPGNTLSVEHSGHVACSEGFRTGSHGLGTRGTWRTRKASGGWLSVWASGTRVTLRRGSEGGLSVGHVPKGFRKGLSVGASRHKAYSEGKFEGGLPA